MRKSPHRRESARSEAWLSRTHFTALVALLIALAVLVAVQAWFGARTRPSAAEAEAKKVDLARFSVFMHRKGCAADCPVYAVLADGKGTLRFEGVAAVKEARSLDAPLDALRARALVAAVLRARFMKQSSAWVPGAAECTSFRHGAEILQFGVTLDGVTHTVDYYAGCDPANAELDLLAREIDAVLDTARWVGAAR